MATFGTWTTINANGYRLNEKKGLQRNIYLLNANDSNHFIFLRVVSLAQ